MDISQYVFEEVCGLSVETLMTARFKQKDMLTHMILVLSREEFLSRIHCVQSVIQDDHGEKHVVRIQPDENMGIYEV